jgi:hypothetical protein
MKHKYWAKRNSDQVGPFASREEAIEAFRAAYPVKGPSYTRAARKNDILSGSGEYGPDFNITWCKADKADEPA